MSKRLIGLGSLLVLAGLVIGGIWLRVPRELYRHEVYTGNVGEITEGVLVGQTFVAEEERLNGVSVMMATYSGRSNTAPIIFSLYTWPELELVREVKVSPEAFGDNQLYRFGFEKVEEAKGQTFFWTVTSPEGRPGNAVTVDVDGRDPYPQGSAFLGRIPVGKLRPEVIQALGKPAIDTTFAVSYEVSVAVAVVEEGREMRAALVELWQQQRDKTIIWLQMLGLAVGLVALLWWIVLSSEESWRGWRLKILLVGLVLAGAGMRWWYARELSFTNDEGNYLYDAWMLSQGKLAGGDGYVKAPLVIGWIWLWQHLSGNALLAGRLASVVIGSLTILPLYFLTNSLAGRRAGLAAGVVWALAGAPVVFTVYAHTQPLMIFFLISALAVVASALTRLDESGRGKRLLVAGALLGLAVVSRKSALAVGVAVLVLIAMFGRNLKRRSGMTLLVGMGFLVVMGAALVLAGQVYGAEGRWELLGFNSAEDGLAELESHEVENARAYSLRGMTPFFRESLPLILLALLGWGLVGEKVGRLLTNRWLAKIMWLPVGGVFWWAWQFFSEYEGTGFMVLGMQSLWYVLAASLLLVALWWPAKTESSSLRLTEKSVIALWLMIPAWVGGLIFFYMNWIKFHANYIGEFLPPLVLMGGIGIVMVSDRLRELRHWGARWLVAAVLSIVLVWALFVSNFVTFWLEHTGTFKQGAIQEAAAWAKANIPSEKTIFTGAAAVPYASGHRVALDIAHPRWYAYEFTRKNTSRLNTFLPPAEDMVQAFREAEWVLLESQTGFSFLMEYSEIEQGLEEDFVQVKGIENGSNTLTFYRRSK
jgi:4-amino-4-deoxy-L-arabinose transferase-like glycosyltransferase